MTDITSKDSEQDVKIAVLFAGIGIITQMDTGDDDWDDEAKIEHVIYRA